MDFSIENNTHQCQDCGMKFYNAAELVNHTKKFCMANGLDSLQGLAKYQNNHSFSKKNKKYMPASMGSLKYQPQPINASRLAQDAKDLRSHREQLQINRAYSNIDPKNQYLPSNSKHQLSYSKHGSRILENSQISMHSLNNFGKQPMKMSSYQNLSHQYQSPPTKMPTYNRKQNTTLLDKSNTSIANMTQQQKRQYASDKLVELDNIANMYDNSGGSNIEFRKNIDKMRKFYRKMIDSQGPIKQFPGQFVESRVQTPINKLRLFNNNTKSQKNGVQYDSLDQIMHDDEKIKNTERKEKQIEKPKKKKKAAKKNEQYFQPSISPSSPYNPYTHSPPYSYSPYPPMNYSPYAPPSQQPQIIMMPSPYTQNPVRKSRRQSSDQVKYYQKMIQMKNKQNKELMSMLMALKQDKDPNKFQKQALKASKISISDTNPPYSNNNQKFYFQQQLNPNLTPQQKILIALQRQELDELRLLSSLPQHLQQIKMQSVMRIIETRTQLQKQILEQKARNLEQQETNQLYEQQRKLRNDQWVTQQRRRMVSHQMNDYLDNFKKKLEGKDQVQEQSEDDDDDQQDVN